MNWELQIIDNVQNALSMTEVEHVLLTRNVRMKVNSKSELTFSALNNSSASVSASLRFRSCCMNSLRSRPDSESLYQRNAGLFSSW